MLIVPEWVNAEDMRIIPDLVYAMIGSLALRLDLYLPKSGKGPFPAIIYIHGGGWVEWNKSAFACQAAYMATRGFVGASVNYRLLPDGIYPRPVYDVKAAVRWLRANADHYKIDPDRIGAAGGSAGGQLAGLLGTTADMPAFEGNAGNPDFSSCVSAVVVFNPAVNLPSMRKDCPPSLKKNLERYLGCKYSANSKLWREASPYYHVNSKSAPFLFIHGDADTIITDRTTIQMVDKLKKCGVRAELFTAHGAEHGFFNSAPWLEPTTKRMEEFFTDILVNPQMKLC